MKTLIIVRHGDYASLSDGPLTERGKDQMRELAEIIRSDANGVVRVLASPITRATQSADILVTALALPGVDCCEVLEVLREGNSFVSEQAAMLEENGNGVDVLLIVTHLNVTEAIAEANVGRKLLMFDRGLAKGSAYIIDQERKRIHIVPQ